MLILIEKCLGWALGLSCLFPGFALFTVGNGTGIQLALLLAIACGGFRLLRRGLFFDTLTCSLLIVWVITLGVSSLAADFSNRSVNAFFAFSANIGLIAIFACTKLHKGDVYILHGMIGGALVNSVYAVYQRIAVELNLPFGVPPLNNISYALYSDFPNLATAGRSYAFCPEPSVLAAVLIPIACLMMARIVAEPHRRTINTVILLVILCGLIMSGSLSLAVSFPICLVIAAAIIFRQRRRIVMTAVGGLSMLCVLSLLVLFWPIATNLFSVVMGRLALGLDDPSIAVRYGAKQASVKVFMLYPLFGDGISPPEEDFISQMPPEALRYELKSGTDSLALQILSGHGAIGFLCFAGLLAIAVKRGTERTTFCIVLLTSVAASTLQVGYESLYHIWVLLGVCNAPLSRVKEENQARLKTNRGTSVPQVCVSKALGAG